MIPQERKLKKINNFMLPLDSIGYKFFNVPFSHRENYFKKIISKITGLNKIINYDNVELKNIDYIYFPLQVNIDSQIIINSRVNNLEALKIAYRISKEKNLSLVVKLHPAETDYHFIKIIQELRSNLGFKLVNYNSLMIVKNAKLIITINSTTGLEGMILDKEVIFLGESFFPKLNKQYLSNYLLSYLLNIDFYSKEKIRASEISKIINRLES